MKSGNGIEEENHQRKVNMERKRDEINSKGLTIARAYLPLRFIIAVMSIAVIINSNIQTPCTKMKFASTEQLMTACENES